MWRRRPLRPLPAMFESLSGGQADRVPPEISGFARLWSEPPAALQRSPEALIRTDANRASRDDGFQKRSQLRGRRNPVQLSVLKSEDTYSASVPIPHRAPCLKPALGVKCLTGDRRRVALAYKAICYELISCF